MKINSFFGILTFFLALSPKIQAQSSLGEGLVAYYPFNGNAKDESGNENNGVIHGANLTNDRFGMEGKAMSFNGIDQYIQVSHQGYLDFSNGDFTISLWLALSDASKRQYIMGKDMGSGINSKWIVHYDPTGDYLPGMGLSFHCVNPITSSMGFYATSGVSLSPVKWHHVLFRKSAIEYDLHLDGFKISSSVGPNSVAASNTAPLTIGQAESNGFVNGKLDDIRIYNRALSDSEVQQLYEIESGPRVDLLRAIKPIFKNLALATNYQLQISTDMNTWTNHGQPFTATNTFMVYPQYWDVVNWSEKYFRLQIVP